MAIIVQSPISIHVVMVFYLHLSIEKKVIKGEHLLQLS